MFSPVRSLNKISCVIFNKGVGCSCHSVGRRELQNTLSTAVLCYPSTQKSLKSKGGFKNMKIHNNNALFMLSKSSSSSSNDDVKGKEKASEPSTFADQLDMKSKIKYMWKSYGAVAIGTYFGLYVTTLSSIFFALDFDIFNSSTVGLDPSIAILKFCDLFEMVTGYGALPNYIRENPRGSPIKIFLFTNALFLFIIPIFDCTFTITSIALLAVGTFAIAWVMTKFTEPLRLAATVLTVPSIARFFGKIPATEKQETSTKLD